MSNLAISDVSAWLETKNHRQLRKFIQGVENIHMFKAVEFRDALLVGQSVLVVGPNGEMAAVIKSVSNKKLSVKVSITDTGTESWVSIDNITKNRES